MTVPEFLRLEAGGGNPADRSGDATTQRPASKRKGLLAFHILNMLAVGGCTARKLSEELEADLMTVYSALHVLREFGLVESSGKTKLPRQKSAAVWTLSTRLRGGA